MEHIIDSWLLKAAVQGILSRMPFGRSIYFWFQLHVTHSFPPDWRCVRLKMHVARRHLQNYYDNTGRLPRIALELGTGWTPAVPLSLGLCGVPVISVDIHDLKKKIVISHMLKILAERTFKEMKDLLPFISAQKFEFLQDSVHLNRPAEEIFEALNIEFLISDARDLDLPTESISLFVSNTTLEHIEREVLEEIMKEFHRLAEPDAISSHNIDISDHFSHDDPNITEYNYLKFGERTWSLFNSNFLYQNRLRLSDYMKIHEDARFLVRDVEPRNMHRDKLNGLKIAQRFAKYDLEDLAATGAWLVARKKRIGVHLRPVKSDIHQGFNSSKHSTAIRTPTYKEKVPHSVTLKSSGLNP